MKALMAPEVRVLLASVEGRNYLRKLMREADQREGGPFSFKEAEQKQQPPQPLQPHPGQP